MSTAMAVDIGIEGFACYCGEDCITPNIDQLTSTGLRFTHAYAHPLCTPTRLEIMTGRGKYRNWKYFGVLPSEEKTFLGIWCWDLVAREVLLASGNSNHALPPPRNSPIRSKDVFQACIRGILVLMSNRCLTHFIQKTRGRVMQIRLSWETANYTNCLMGNMEKIFRFHLF